MFSITKRQMLTLTNSEVKSLTGLHWWQTNAIREEVARRGEWLAARRFGASMTDQSPVWVWSYDANGRRTGLRQIAFGHLRLAPAGRIANLHVAREQFAVFGHHALTAAGRTRRPAVTSRWQSVERPTPKNNYGAHHVEPLEVVA